MKTKIMLFMAFALILLAFRDDKPAYRVFTNDGGKTSYTKMMKEIQKADIIFFGELHNNSIAHWLELEIAKELAETKGANLVIGAEMFEADNQTLVDEFVKGLINEKTFEDQSRLWKNYLTDYKPILMLAKEKKLAFIATNVPRRYAAIVSKEGFDGLTKFSDEAKKSIAPLPIQYDGEVPCYKNMLNMMGTGNAHASDNIVKAQALKDATMAHFILKNFQAGKTFYHFNGSYHSDNHEGIIWYINKKQPGLKIVTVSVMDQTNINKVDSANLKKADYIICVPENMTKTN